MYRLYQPSSLIPGDDFVFQESKSENTATQEKDKADVRKRSSRVILTIIIQATISVFPAIEHRVVLLVWSLNNLKRLDPCSKFWGIMS